MIDVVYVLGSGSMYQNIELYHSLRSIVKYLQDYRDVYIIGEDPGFGGNFYHVPAADHNFNTQDNIRRKIEVACAHPDITDNFLFFNDDFFLLRPVSAIDFPYYYSYDLKAAYDAKRKPGRYKRTVGNTIEVLSAAGLPQKHFDIHVPIIYNKYLFPHVMNRYNWKKKNCYIIKSLYCNTLKIEGEFLPDCKIGYACEEGKQLKELTEGRFMFSIDTGAVNDVLLEWLQDLYK